jgi:outer membrane protein OmpA-like peptidoglycan-associated protein
MLRYTLLFSLIFFIFEGRIAFGYKPVSVPDTSVQRLKEIEDLMTKGGYISAVQELELIRSRFPKAFSPNVLLAKSYLALKQYEKAEDVLKQIVLVKVKKGDPYLRFHLAYTQLRLGKKKDASTNLSLFEASRPPFQAAIWAEVKQMKISLNRKDTLATSKDRFQMDPDFQFPNSAYADFSPIAMGDTAFLFSSLRQDSLVEYTPGQPNFNTIQLYQYSIRPDGRFDEISLVKNLNVPGYHTGNGCFSSDGRRFFFTRCTDGPKGKPNCSIYEAEVRKDGSFHKIRKLSDRINRRKYSSSQPFITTITLNGVEQDVLYFVSNRRGGFGKNDIWFSVYNRKRKRFSGATNAGFTVNSAGDDESPFLNAQGTRFFFSSDGFPGHGGKDVFCASVNGLYFTHRELLAQPINSVSDDHYFSLSEDGNSGHLASNRKGANELDKTWCCEDVFRFKKFESEKAPSVEPIVSADTLQPVMAVVPPPFVPAEIIPPPVSIPIVEAIPEPKTAVAQISVAKVNSNHDLSEDGFQRRKVYFKNNSSVLSKKSQQNLMAIWKEWRSDKAQKIVVLGFADVSGPVALNKKLSKNRAKSVVAFLKKMGVKTPLELGSRDLSQGAKTADKQMLSLDRFVEISWKDR